MVTVSSTLSLAAGMAPCGCVPGNGTCGFLQHTAMGAVWNRFSAVVS